jgi:hypothetical protein
MSKGDPILDSPFMVELRAKAERRALRWLAWSAQLGEEIATKGPPSVYSYLYGVGHRAFEAGMSPRDFRSLVVEPAMRPLQLRCAGQDDSESNPGAEAELAMGRQLFDAWLEAKEQTDEQ